MQSYQVSTYRVIGDLVASEQLSEHPRIERRQQSFIYNCLAALANYPFDLHHQFTQRQTQTQTFRGINIMAQVLTLSDGRKLEYLISGASDGFPLVYIHGTPGSLYTGSDLEAACTKKGIKLINLNRAGYGGSTRNRGRTIVDFVADIHALLQHLGVKECVVGGRSGGGES